MSNKVYILLDRSGSMGPLWREAIGSINGFVDKLQDRDAVVYVAIFDDQGYNVIRNEAARNFTAIGYEEYLPRGMTPLYDAAGRVFALAEGERNDLTTVVIMTDGMENASKEYTQAAITERVAAFEAKNWPVIFLGADFKEVRKQAASVGGFQRRTHNLTKGTMAQEFGALAAMHGSYTSTGLADSYSWDKDES
jgi:Mg-chelatase subunit ChlD